uniref:Zf-C5HC2 domain-containing protein n=1 Tax=Haemonchus placei TaxID=6290 RepID=A0A158QMQ7_HAEPC
LALECMQCDKNAAWYSEEEHERHIEMCQHGLVPPTPCRNSSHTHCIVSWYRSGGSTERVVTERKCGGVEDVTGCTLYNSKISRKVSSH